MSNWDLKTDEEIDFDDVVNIFKNILVKLSVKDFVIILLIFMMFLIYVIHTRDIESCNIYYQNLLKNTTRLTTSLW